MLSLNTRSAVAGAFLALASHSAVTGAQPPRKPPIALLVLSPAPLQGGRAMVRMRAAAVPRDVILLDDGASETDLVAAVQTLSNMRRRFGDTSEHDVRAVVKSVVPGPGWKRSRQEAERTAQLRNLANAPYRDVQGVGHVRSFPIVIPPWRAGIARPGKP